MKKTNKKLHLTRESIRTLRKLDMVYGGEPIGSIEVCIETAPACTPPPSMLGPCTVVSNTNCPIPRCVA